MSKSIKLNASLNAFRMALTVLVPLITFPYTSRIFLADGTGQLNFASSVSTIFCLIASLGIYTYGVREGVKIRNDKEKFSKFAQELLIINAIATVVAYIIFFVLLKTVVSFKGYRTLLLIYSAQIVFTAMGCDWVFGVYEEYTYITIRQILVQIVTIISMFLFVHKKEDIYIWACISVLSSVGANIFNVFYASKYISFKRRSKYCLTAHIVQILTLFATQIASKVYNNLDTVLLGMMAQDYDVGIYSAAVKVNTILITVFAAMSPVFVPRVIVLLSEHKREEYFSFINSILTLILGLTIPTCVGIILLRKQIVEVLAGKSFIEASSTMAILVPIIMVSSLSNVLYYDILVPLGKEKQVLLSTIISAVINLVISVFLIPSLKANGAAVGSLIAECVGLVIAFYCCKKNNGIVFSCIPNILPYILGSVGIVGVCLVCHAFFSTNLILDLLISIGLSVFIYAIVLLLFRDPLAQEGMATCKKIVYKIRGDKK